ncbi:aldose epimerase family protein [Spirosoma fluminis]
MQKIVVFSVVLATLISLNGCKQANKTEQKAADSIAVATGDTTAMLTAKLPDPTAFEGTVKGRKTGLYILKNKTIQVAVTNYGARLVGLLVPDKTGKVTDVVPGFTSLKAYEQANEPFYGPIVGRFGNRIAQGKFMLDGRSFQLELNNNGNTLHSGPTGFHTQVWDANQTNDQTLELTYVAKDGEGGFPGTVTTKVTYTLTDDNGLKIDYTATTDKATPYNPTSHGFFNLNGEASGTINDHVLMINADRYSVVDKGLIPQGEPASVAGTPFDFRKSTAIGARVDEKNEQLTFGGGYDHNWVLNKSGNGLAKVAEITGDKSGIKMEILTTEPALQFYGGNFFKGNDMGKYGKATNFREAFALEAQHYPDAPNHPTYPNTILKPGQTYRQTTEYRFSVVK